MTKTNSIQLGFRSPGLRELNPAEKMALAKELAVQFIEPQCAAHEVADLDYARAMGDAAAAAQISINSCGCVMNLSDPDADYLERVQFAINACKEMNCGYVFSTIHNAPDKQEAQSVTWERIIPRTAETVKILGDHGIRFAIEPDKGNFIDSAERLEQLLDAVNDERLLVNFDCCNLYLSGSDPLRALRLFKDRIQSGHIKDGWYHGRHPQEAAVGAGEVPWVDIIPAMEALGIHCPMHVEHCNNVTAVRDAIEHIRSIKAVTV
jgi:sugar phosphate isomerase/epimerase